MLYGSEGEDEDSEDDSLAKNMPKSKVKGLGPNARRIPGVGTKEGRLAKNEMHLRMDNEDPVDLLHAGANTITGRPSLTNFEGLLMFRSIKSIKETTAWPRSISFHDRRIRQTYH